MSKQACLALLLLPVALACSSPPEQYCRDLGLVYDPSADRCRCPAGTIGIDDECVTIDGGRVGEDAGRDRDAGERDAGPDAALACGELTACDGACVDLTSDPAHCGTCTTACVTGDTCVNGECFDPVVQLTAGSGHTCARRRSGSLWCWGDNRSGQLGNGTFAPASVPTRVEGIADAIDIDTDGGGTIGGGHTCALRRSGDVLCWGANHLGTVGDGTTEPRSSPVSVGVSAAGRVLVGWFHSCALRGVDTQCWGLAPFLGLPESSSTPTPSTYIGGSHANSSEGTTCFAAGGGVSCWPDQMGSSRTRAITGLPSGRTVVALEPECVLFDDGRAFYWDTFDAVAADFGFTDVRAIAAGGGLACARRADGSTWCRGADYRTEPPALRSEPTPIPELDGLVSMASGYEHFCGIAANGTAHCFGTNDVGQLGDGTRTYARAPVRVRLPPR